MKTDHSSIHIRQIAVTKRPIWFDVSGERLSRLELHAAARFWPSGAGSAALLQFDFVEPVDAALLTSYGISSSALGHYVYLVPSQPDSTLHLTITLPRVKLRRIAVRLWNSPAPVVLAQLSIRTEGGALESTYAESAPEAGLGRLAGTGPVLGLNLLGVRHTCEGLCYAICQNWYETMDDAQRRHPKNDVGRTNFRLPSGADGVSATVYHGQPAMLRIPESIAAYLASIGDKSRNMIRKAERAGYVYREANPDHYLDDILAIRTSDPIRQGKAIPEYFKTRPASVYDQPFNSACPYHGETFYGIFKDERLVAYATIYLYGELGQVNHILGHKEHLSEGVMNLLVYAMVDSIIAQRPWIKAINYLYRDNDVKSGVGLFKKSIGFHPENLVVTQDEFDLYGHFAAPAASEKTTGVSVRPARKSVKADVNRGLKAAASLPLITLAEPAEDSTAARLLAIEKVAQIAPGLVPLRYQRTGAAVEAAHFTPSATHVIVFEDLRFEECQDFLSSKLKALRTSVPAGSFIMFDFKCTPDIHYVPRRTGLARFVPRVLRPRAPAVNERLLRYFEQRFKSASLTLDDLRTGFKGSDYTVAGLIGYRAALSPRSLDSLLILQKIR